MFRVGDFIKGTRKGDELYSCTGSEMTLGKVIAVDKELKTMNIDILFHKNKKNIGRNFNVEMEFFELVDNLPYNHIVHIISAPFGAIGINNYIGTIIDKKMADKLKNEYNFSAHGLHKNSNFYFIPLSNLNNFDIRSKQIWGLGSNLSEIGYMDITLNKEFNLGKKMTLKEIEKELGYKIELIQ